MFVELQPHVELGARHSTLGTRDVEPAEPRVVTADGRVHDVLLPSGLEVDPQPRARFEQRGTHRQRRGRKGQALDPPSPAAPHGGARAWDASRNYVTVSVAKFHSSGRRCRSDRFTMWAAAAAWWPMTASSTAGLCWRTESKNRAMCTKVASGPSSP